jgi:hypothetical protein
MSVVVVISQHLLNVFVQLANKRGFKKKKNVHTVINFNYIANESNFIAQEILQNGDFQHQIFTK